MQPDLLSFYLLRCPWILLIAIPSLTNLNVLTLMPWIDRELQSHPTPCSYVTCMVLGFYGAIFQLTIAVRDGTALPKWEEYFLCFGNNLTPFSRITTHTRRNL